MKKSVSALKKNVCAALAAILFATAVPAAVYADNGGNDMKTEVFQISSAYDIGIDPENVRLGWRIVTSKRGVFQSAYKCVVTDEYGTIAWDSGWVDSAVQTGVNPGKLQPETVYTAKVSVKDQNGAESTSCKELVFETAPDPVEGEWISTERLLRRVFTLDQPKENIERARCYLASTGVIEIRLNGGKVGDLIWGPRKAVADKTAYYNTYDITNELKNGENCVGAYVSGNTYMNRDLCGMLRIKYKDGSTQTVKTDGDWQACASSEIVTENIASGENIDMTKKTPWDTPEYKTGAEWKKAESLSFAARDGELLIPDNSGIFTTYQTFKGNYTIEAVITVRKTLGAIMFGVKDGVSSPLMWQVTASGLRLHRVGWTEIDTPAAPGLGVNKPVTMRIDVNNGTVTTTVNGKEVHKISLPKDQTEGALGIRSALNEVASYDRITVTQDGKVLWEDDFDTVDTGKWNFPGVIKLTPSPAGTKVIKEIKPVSVKEISKNVYVLDFGVNMQGYVRMTASGRAKDSYKIEYSELLKENGDIWPNTTAHRPSSTYTLSGGDDVFEPRFFYTGFRYIRVTAPDGVPFDPDTFTACFTSDDVIQTGFFTSSNERLNRVFDMYNVSQRSNMMGNYTDCPQREKNGWTGDAAVTKESCAILLNDYTTADAYLDAMLADVKADGRPQIVVPVPSSGESGAVYDITWASAIFIFPYELYMQTGDKYYVEKSIDTLIKVFEYAKKDAQGYIVTHNVYGDWVGFDNQNGLVDRGFLSASCFYNCGMLLSEMLKIADRDSEEHDVYMQNVYDAIQKKYRKNAYYGGKTQTNCSMALDFGLVPDEYKKEVVDTVLSLSEKKNRTLGTGVLGTKSIYDALSAAHEHKMLLDITVNPEKCSFGYMLDNGATSMWEYWDTAGNNINSKLDPGDAFWDSQNHVMHGGGPACWMFQGLGGIRATGAGYSTVDLRPGIESGLESVSVRIDALTGAFRSEWTYKDGALVWEIEVPSNTKASVTVPLASPRYLYESGHDVNGKSSRDVVFEGYDADGYQVFSLGGGVYRFTNEYAPAPETDTVVGEDTDTVTAEPGSDGKTGKKPYAAVIAAGTAAVIAAFAVVFAVIRKKKNKH